MNPSVFHKISGVGKVYGKKGGEEGGSITIFRQFFFVSLPKKFDGEPFIVSLISDIGQF